MREIKFRAWEKSFQEIIPVDNIDFSSKLINTNGPWRFFSEVELMQYTGQKDVNGKEIYEGDIVRIADRVTAVCKWSQTYCEFNLKGIAGGTYSIGYRENGRINQKVIGNIYENPELLTIQQRPPEPPKTRIIKENGQVIKDA